MKRRAIPEAIGLSVMDLVCGLFGLLVTLYAITSLDDLDPGVRTADISFVKAEVAGDAPITVGVEMRYGGKTARSWPDCTATEDVVWSVCDPGQTSAQLESDDPLDGVGLFLRERPDRTMIGGDPIMVRVSMKDGVFLCSLAIDRGYRVSIELAAPAGDCVRQ